MPIIMNKTQVNILFKWGTMELPVKAALPHNVMFADGDHYTVQTIIENGGAEWLRDMAWACGRDAYEINAVRPNVRQTNVLYEVGKTYAVQPAHNKRAWWYRPMLPSGIQYFEGKKSPPPDRVMRLAGWLQLRFQIEQITLVAEDSWGFARRCMPAKSESGLLYIIRGKIEKGAQW